MALLPNQQLQKLLNSRTSSLLITIGVFPAITESKKSSRTKRSATGVGALVQLVFVWTHLLWYDEQNSSRPAFDMFAAIGHPGIAAIRSQKSICVCEGVLSRTQFVLHSAFLVSLLRLVQNCAAVSNPTGRCFNIFQISLLKRVVVAATVVGLGRNPAR